MTSGVYELKFANGHRYIGKSIDIDNRWAQHMDKLRKGTAARNMQNAYNMYGAPQGDVLLECHPDHIDIMEAVYIARHNPELNSDRPKDPFPGVDIDWYINNTNFLKVSTLEHMITLAEDASRTKRLQGDISNLHKEIEELEDLNDQLLVKRTEEEINSAAEGRFKDLYIKLSNRKKQLTDAEIQIKQLLQDLNYAKHPWWKRIFF